MQILTPLYIIRIQYCLVAVDNKTTKHSLKIKTTTNSLTLINGFYDTETQTE